MNLQLGDTELIIEAGRRAGLLRNQLAYVLATTYHETAHTMKPVTEYGSQSYLRAKKYWPYIGRGYVQLTWDYNYKKAGDKVGVNLLVDPHLALSPQYAAPILVDGMVEGWFTGKKLSNYITLQKSDFVQARRIVNGMDRAELIAGYAKQYDENLKTVGYGDIEYTPIPTEKPVQSVPVKEATDTTPWWVKLIQSLLRGK